MATSIEVHKEAVGHTFRVEIDDNGRLRLDGSQAILEGNIVRVFNPIKIKGQTCNGIKVEGAARTQIQELVAEGRARQGREFEAEQARREADRPAPYVDKDEFFIYNTGIDSHQIYPREKERAIIHALKGNQWAGVKVFSGARDETRAYPNQYDTQIPAGYVKEDESGKFSASGYKRVWHELVYAIEQGALAQAEAELKAMPKPALDPTLRARIESIPVPHACDCTQDCCAGKCYCEDHCNCRGGNVYDC